MLINKLKNKNESPEDIIENLIYAYQNSRETYVENKRVFRGRSHSVSGIFEDLFADYLSKNLPDSNQYFVDQQLFSSAANIRFFPDILIMNDKINRDIIDLKLYFGWSRNDVFSFCDTWNKKIDKLKGTSFTFNDGITKEKKNGFFSDNLKYHVVVSTKLNNGSNFIEIKDKVTKNLEHVELYILTDKVHPNDYNSTAEERVKNIHICMSEFSRLMNNLS
ncbi:hypothetical protein ACY4ML_002547 [Proteus mirabilis]|nr:hypothetical protein [Proteus mirabilis]EKU5483344.1 hypothetical protein [Proteus mirabilis]EKV7657121.1 hypothetical protein [Proteus mirabilis]EMB6072878.1 hypothetical protein [Proteus mirabilis]